jgi:hypothetical protein
VVGPGGHGDGHAVASGRADVDHVVADAEQGDGAEVAGGLEHALRVGLPTLPACRIRPGARRSARRRLVPAERVSHDLEPGPPQAPEVGRLPRGQVVDGGALATPVCATGTKTRRGRRDSLEDRRHAARAPSSMSSTRSTSAVASPCDLGRVGPCDAERHVRARARRRERGSTASARQTCGPASRPLCRCPARRRATRTARDGPEPRTG